ncbi:hypothetical protein KIS1582_1972 [Cytobacillus firmus]|uniref:Uncharacterized protein n=1 Tax=Cytobacillus firmus TaxID=1399 RepID=A0A800MXH8_CYTFI|nr:hypothetical protein [Cytobacillus firmus]KAF0824293.1 hypothetical protein KIS1582_1972 [Cytobacillus firmus]
MMKVEVPEEELIRLSYKIKDFFYEEYGQEIGLICANTLVNLIHRDLSSLYEKHSSEVLRSHLKTISSKIVYEY